MGLGGASYLWVAICFMLVLTLETRASLRLVTGWEAGAARADTQPKKTVNADRGIMSHAGYEEELGAERAETSLLLHRTA